MTLPDLYFAFGSNLAADQMAARCPGSSVFLPGALAGYRLAFIGIRSKWGDGGTATIEAAPEIIVHTPDNSVNTPDSSVHTPEKPVHTPDNSVPGLLYRMTPGDVEALNGFENYPTTYDHLLIEVAGEDGATYPAFTYQRAGGPANPPPMKYFHHIWRAYKAFGLDESALWAAVERSLNHGR